MTRHCFLPPYLLRELARRRPDGEQWVARHLAQDDAIRLQRALPPNEQAVAGPDWVVHTAENGSELPGRVVRTAGDPASGDPAVDEAADGVAASLAMFSEVYGRDSYDGAGATVLATVHYEQDYDNAFWDGTQLVFGDGDGEVFDRFTKAVDVLGHELTHAVTERTAGLVYEGQSGALNESVSDVFAACLKQRLLGQDAAAADWLIGAELFLPGINARGLRDMAQPGHGVRRPGARARTRSRRTSTTTSRPPTTTAGCTSTPASPTARSSWPRWRSVAPRPRGPAGSGTPRSPVGCSAHRADFADVRGGDRGRGRRARRRRHRGVGRGRRHPGHEHGRAGPAAAGVRRQPGGPGAA